MNDTISCYFKRAYEADFRLYDINTLWSMDEFLHTMKECISRDFGLNNADIVEAGQDTFPLANEEANALVSEPIQFRDKYVNKTFMASYFRPVTHVPRNEPRNILRTEVNVTSTATTNVLQVNHTVIPNRNECTICFETVPTNRPYGCRHEMCGNCFDRCSQHNYASRCPTCSRETN